MSNSVLASAKVHWRYFNQYFSDAGWLALDAYRLVDKTGWDAERRSRYTRASILYSAIALEAAANACLDVLRLEKGTHADFERLQTLGKFEVFLAYVNPDKKFDRGHKLVTPIRNLISCRNEYVHSKVLAETAVKGAINAAVWKPLGLPHNNSYWQALHAVKTFTVASDFLNHFFFDVAGYPYEGSEGRSAVAQMLSSGVAQASNEKLPGNVEFSSVRDNTWATIAEVAKEWDLEFAFLGTGSHDGKGNQIFPKRKLGDYSHCKVEKLKIPWTPIAYNAPGGLGVIMVGPPRKNPRK